MAIVNAVVEQTDLLDLEALLPSRLLGYRLYTKRLIDILLSSVMILLVLPILLLIAFTLLATRSPVLFRHQRVGLQGEYFDCLKFQTMHKNAAHLLARLLDEDPNAEEEWLKTRKIRNDPRVTRFGRFLRTTSLDELPQLLNVLRGDMSLVGPRPVVLDELQHHYNDKAAEAYLSVRPGLTGLWQVSGRSDTDYGQRVALDYSYVQSLSIRTDILLLMRTVMVLLRRDGAY